MARSQTNPHADAYVKAAKKWRDEMGELRKIILGFPLVEEFKWDKPCYTFQGKNVVILVGFKNHCALIFAKGALLEDPKGILIKPGENTQAARQARFTSLDDIAAKKAALKSCLQQAVAVAKSGRDIVYKKITEVAVPEEFQNRLNKNAALKKAFTALTPGRQRAYLMHFSAAKQSQTREARIDKYTPQILKARAGTRIIGRNGASAS
jgi:uncharacterized protein YdeI (YjbR/CyaY-like superfamily)